MAKKHNKKAARLTEDDRTLLRDALSSYGSEVKKLAKKSESLGLTDEAEGFQDTLRELGVLYGKITGESQLEDADDSAEDDGE